MSKCPICGCGELAVSFHKDALTLLRSKGCGVKFQSPMPSPENLDRLYSSREYREDFYPERVNQARLERFNHHLENLERLRGGARGACLDIGCGRGRFVEAALARGWEVHARAFSRQTAERLRQPIPADFVTGGFPDKAATVPARFDLIHLNHVLEHLYEPEKGLAQAYELLRPGGLFYCEVPRQSNAQHMLADLAGGKDVENRFLPERLFIFDRKSLSLMLRRQGFEIAYMRVEGMGDPYRSARGAHYRSLGTHCMVMGEKTLRIQNVLGCGNLVAIARKTKE